MSTPENTDSSQYSRKIRNAKEFRIEKDRLAYEAAKKLALTTSRPIDEDLYIRGIGSLRIQILYCPSFAPSFMWDIREHPESEGSFEVYENAVQGRTTILPGYKKLRTDDTTIKHLVKEIKATKITLQLEPILRAGLDGELYGLTIYNELHREVRLRWLSEPPQELQQLHETLLATIDVFKSTAGKTDVV